MRDSDVRRVLAVVATVGLSGCMTVRATREERTAVLSSYVEHVRSADAVMRVRSRPIDTAPSRPELMAMEVLVVRSHECMERRFETVRKTTTVTRTLEQPQEPLIELGVGGACLVGSTVAFSIGSPTSRDDITGEVRPSVGGFFGGLLGTCAIGTVVPALVNLARAIDSAETGAPEQRTRETPSVVCDSEPAASVRVDLIDSASSAPRAPLATATTDLGGVAPFELDRAFVSSRADSLRVFVDGVDVAPLEIPAELRRQAPAALESPPTFDRPASSGPSF